MAIMPTWTILGGGYQAYLKGDYATALGEWLPLAELGDAEAEFNVGVMYDQGHGVTQDFGEAAKWYHKAASQGFVDAQINLGMMHSHGHGVTRNHILALMWYKRAAAQGDETAREYARQIARKMSADDIAEARELSLQPITAPELVDRAD